MSVDANEVSLPTVPFAFDARRAPLQFDSWAAGGNILTFDVRVPDSRSIIQEAGFRRGPEVRISLGAPVSRNEVRAAGELKP